MRRSSYAKLLSRNGACHHAIASHDNRTPRDSQPGGLEYALQEYPKTHSRCSPRGQAEHTGLPRWIKTSLGSSEHYAPRQLQGQFLQKCKNHLIEVMVIVAMNFPKARYISPEAGKPWAANGLSTFRQLKTLLLHPLENGFCEI